MVCADALRWPRACRKSRTAFSTTVDFAGDAMNYSSPRSYGATEKDLIGFLRGSVSPWLISIFLPRLRSGMMLLIHRLQPIQRHVRVDLRRRNVSMAQDSLHRS